MEFMALDHSIKEINDRTVIGFAAITGNVDSGQDRLQRGAFKKTLKENGRRLRHLWMHDASQPPTAVIREIKEVGVEELPESIRQEFPEAKGGLMVAREYLATPRGDEILAGLKAGAVNEMSFAYDPVKFDFVEEETKDGGRAMVRNLKEVRLWETSDVNWGMNPATVASKSYLDGRIQELLNYAEGIKAGRVLSARNMTRLKEALAVLAEILTAAEPQEEESLKALTDQLLLRIAIAERELL